MTELLDTSPLRDQRTMTGDRLHRTVADVQAGWEEWAAKHGMIVRARRGDPALELRHSKTILPVYISGGRWIADCPNCNGGVAAWPYHGHGACLDCGTIYRLDYPTGEEVARAVELLTPRREEHRNWHRHLGEDVEHLEIENRLLPTTLQPHRVTVDVAELEQTLSSRTLAELRRKGVI